MGQIFTAASEQTVARKELIAYIKVKEQYVPVGWHCTDSSISVEIDTETQKDILGSVFTIASAPELSQDFDPLPIRQGSEEEPLQKLQQMLHDQWMSQDFSKTYDTLIVYCYAGEGEPGAQECKYDAHRFPASTITPGDFGGSAEDPLSRPITIHYGGQMEVGTAEIDTKTRVATFTKSAG